MLLSAFRMLALLAGLAAPPALAQAPGPAVPSTPAAPPTAAAKETAKETAKPAEKAVLLDINSATIEELSALKGIGEVRSAAIVKGRPYKGKDELVQRKIIPDAVYADIKDKIIAKQK